MDIKEISIGDILVWIDHDPIYEYTIYPITVDEVCEDYIIAKDPLGYTLTCPKECIEDHIFKYYCGCLKEF